MASVSLEKTESIWMDGKLIPWDDANVHILTHTLHYGLGVFEGIRAYQRADGRTAIFRLNEHIQRLFDSAKIVTIDIPYTREQIAQACVDTVRASKLPSAYLRPIVFLGYGALGLGSRENPVVTAVAAYKWGAYLGEDGLKRGIRAKVSSYVRGHVNSNMAKGKICGQYVNSILAKREALKSGYDEAIMLDSNGLVAEASGENLFMVKNGIVKTPPLTSAILAGVTRDSMIRIARDLGYEVREETFARDELWCADEVFLTGTAAECTPVREIDDRTIGRGECGPVTKRLQDTFFDAVKGEKARYPDWLAYV